MKIIITYKNETYSKLSANKFQNAKNWFLLDKAKKFVISKLHCTKII